jgi:hypothetical protein
MEQIRVMFILTALNFGAQFKEFALRLFCTGSGICLQCMQNEIWFDSSPYVVSKSIPIHALVRACFGCRTEKHLLVWFKKRVLGPNIFPQDVVVGKSHSTV